MYSVIACCRASVECTKRKCAFFFVHERRSFAAGVKAQGFVRTVISKDGVWMKRGVQSAMRILMVVAIAFLVGGLAMAKEKKTASDPRIGNLSKVRREQLADKVSQIRSYLLEASAHDKNAARLLSFVAELEKEVRSKKYGLVFEEHKERVDIELEENIPVLKENRKRFIDNGGEMNFLIEGDNLAALKLLEKTHRGKIDLIYIDPPYNTGNKDFIYNDSFVDKTDGYRHSKWLSFMEKRLKLAKSLLSSKGVIFISIDDNEQAALKLLCEQLFGVDNFITCFPWQSRQSLQNDTDISVNHEYVVCFAKRRRQKDRRLKPSNADSWYDRDGFVFYPMAVNSDKYDNPDEDPRGPWKADPFDAPGIRENLEYKITNPITGQQYLPPKGRHWRMTEEKFKKALKEGRIQFGKNGKSKPSLKVFLNEQEKFGAVANSWLEASQFGTSTHGSKELQAVFNGNKVFDSPKPTSLIVGLMKISSLPQKEYTILDFFAGSGTTGHAVMKLNAEDGGKRKFILVTNNENGICEKVTYERLKRVIAKEKYAARLKYLKVDYVPITEEGYWERAEELLKYIRELVELENGIDFAHDKSVAIVLTDKEAELFLKNEKRLSACKTLYRGHNVMFTAKMNSVLSEHGISVKTIPDYYYPELED